MAKEAKIYILDAPYHVDKAYSYYIPDTLADEVKVGCAVDVPFTKGNRQMTGIVAEICGDADPENGKLKPVLQALGDGPVVSEELLGLSRFVKDYTLCTFGEALRAMIPPAAMAKVVTCYRAVPESECQSPESFRAALNSVGDRGRLLYELALKKPRFTRQYLQAETGQECTRLLNTLTEKGLCEKCTEIREEANVLKKRFLRLSDGLRDDPEAFEAALDSLTGANQKKLFAALRDHDGSDEGLVFSQAEIASSAGRTAVKALEKKGFLTVSAEEVYRNPFTREALLAEAERNTEPVRPVLNDEQAAARDKIVALYESGQPCAALLHGVTGSGKTNVILAAIDRVLEDGRGVIMLVPEIALTPQTVGIFLRRYGDRIAVIHSGLSAGERCDAWRRIRDGLAPVVIGTRSAIFAPLPKIGLIVIDEEHEYTYKSDVNPKYHTHDIARYRCRDHNAVLVLASATPSVVSYYKAKTGAYTLIELKQRYGNAVLPTVKIADLRAETAQGNLSPIGGVLAERMREDKREGNQSILFLNRRGYNNYVSCRSCGKSLKCPNCSVTLTYHANKRRLDPADPGDKEAFELNRRENGYLTCHICGTRAPLPDKCPECGKEHFLFMGCGTQKAEDDIAAAFPDLRILRMDSDTTQAKFAHEEILSRFRAGEADVLLGTQMVTKGHDFPKVATVGVLNADASYAVEDYRAGERMFAMLTQVIGRAGRGDVPGVAVIQTHNPDNEILRLAAEQDYPRFYEGEIRLRKALCFPPFCDIAVVTLSSAAEGFLGQMTALMKRRIVELTRGDYSDLPLMLYGPFEAPVYRVQNLCRMRFVIKCRVSRRMREFLAQLLCEFTRSGPSRYQYGMVDAATNQRLSVSVDLNPSTV